MSKKSHANRHRQTLQLSRLPEGHQNSGTPQPAKLRYVGVTGRRMTFAAPAVVLIRYPATSRALHQFCTSHCLPQISGDWMTKPRAPHQLWLVCWTSLYARRVPLTFQSLHHSCDSAPSAPHLPRRHPGLALHTVPQFGSSNFYIIPCMMPPPPSMMFGADGRRPARHFSTYSANACYSRSDERGGRPGRTTYQ